MDMGKCRLAREEHVAMDDVDIEDVFLLEENIWLGEMSSGWRRAYGYGRYLLVILLKESICKYERCPLEMEYFTNTVKDDKI